MRKWTKQQTEALHKTNRDAWNVWKDCQENAAELFEAPQEQDAEALAQFATEYDARFSA